MTFRMMRERRNWTYLQLLNNPFAKDKKQLHMIRNMCTISNYQRPWTRTVLLKNFKLRWKPETKEKLCKNQQCGSCTWYNFWFRNHKEIGRYITRRYLYVECIGSRRTELRSIYSKRTYPDIGRAIRTITSEKDFLAENWLSTRRKA